MRFKKIAVIAVCILLLGGIVYLMIPKIAALKYRNAQLERCSTSTGGGMLGGSWSAELERDGDGAILTIRERETHAHREISTVYQVDPAAFDHIREIVNRCNLFEASKRRRSPVQVLDGDTSSLSFRYDVGSFYISDQLMLNKRMRDGFREVDSYLYSLAVGEGVTTVEPQTASLYLRSGYTLQFIVAEAFDGKLEGILDEETEVARAEDYGIVLHELAGWEESPGEAAEAAAAGQLIYDPESGQFILLYADHDFGHPVWQLAELDGYVKTACPLIEEMEGSYSLYLNQ